MPSLLRFLRRRAYRDEKYGFKIEWRINPAHMLLSCQLSSARFIGAKSLIYGIPENLPVGIKEKAQEIALYDPAESTKDLFPNGVIPFFGTPGSEDACKMSVQLESSTGWYHVPCISQCDDEYCVSVGVYVWLFPHFLQAIQERLVSLNATRQNPQPLKYIEFDTFSRDRDIRPFAEVKLWLESNNAIRIDILGFRDEANSVRASSSVLGE